MADLNALSNALIAGDSETLKGLVQGALNEGMEAKEILNGGLIKGMDIVGEKMQNGDMFIPEVLM
ncbi:MAG: B12-binding domain-containing protein, partial [Deltaproteobacteria bacterium]|nr:B12-binding domain-containing protein [Deltaproteobacteria bacterium]